MTAPSRANQPNQKMICKIRRWLRTSSPFTTLSLLPHRSIGIGSRRGSRRTAGGRLCPSLRKAWLQEGPWQAPPQPPSPSLSHHAPHLPQPGSDAFFLIGLGCGNGNNSAHLIRCQVLFYIWFAGIWVNGSLIMNEARVVSHLVKLSWWTTTHLNQSEYRSEIAQKDKV